MDFVNLPFTMDSVFASSASGPPRPLWGWAFARSMSSIRTGILVLDVPKAAHLPVADVWLPAGRKPSCAGTRKLRLRTTLETIAQSEAAGIYHPQLARC